jgi:streptogramin lyase
MRHFPIPRVHGVDRRLPAAVAIIAAAALVAPVSAQDSTPVPAGSPGPEPSGLTAPTESGLDRIELPDAWQPEGIAFLDDQLFVGSLADGAIWRADPLTGEGSIFVPGTEGAVAVGLEADEANGRLWVAGGDTGEVRVYAADGAELLETYRFEAGFLNDLVATPEAVYVTDSFMPQILVVPLHKDGSLPASDQGRVLPISGELEYGDGFNANGIVAAPAGLIVVHSSAGELFRVDPASGVSSRIDLGDATVSAGDGMELDGDTLYVVRNQLNQIAVLELDDGATSATQVAELGDDGFDVPTTVALRGDDLWAVNARFGTEATPDTEYWVTRLDAAPAEGDPGS